MKREEGGAGMDNTIFSFTEALASSAPTPGGGGAAGLIAALGASLGAMAARISAKKRDTAELAERCEALRLRALALIEADEEAFLPLSAAYRLPKDAPNRAETLRRAALDACQPGVNLLLLCAEAADVLAALREKASPLLLSDVGCAAAACRAALLCAAMNVYVNTKPCSGDAEAARLNALAESALQAALPKLEDTELQILLRLRDGNDG